MADNKTGNRPILSLKKKRSAKKTKTVVKPTSRKKAEEPAVEPDPPIDPSLAERLHNRCRQIAGVKFRAIFLSDTHVRVQVSIAGEITAVEKHGAGKKRIKHLAVAELYPQIIEQIEAFSQIKKD